MHARKQTPHAIGGSSRSSRTALTDDFKKAKVKGIVPFEIAVTRLEGKYKLSQNRARDEQERIAQSLSGEADSVRAGVGEMMKRLKELDTDKH